MTHDDRSAEATVTLFAPRPGAPGVHPTSGTAVLIDALLGVLKFGESPLRSKIEWLQMEPEARGALAATRRSAAELRRLLADRSRCQLLIYPNVPGLVSYPAIRPLPGTRRAYQWLRARSALGRSRIALLIDALPLERAEGAAIADGRTPTIEAKRIRPIEASLFRAARRLIAPPGFADLIRERYDIPAARLHSLRLLPYPPRTPGAPAPPPDFDAGTVNFFYSGGVDSAVAPNFRAVLKSIRNAPQTRLHVCGPGGDELREWLAELDVPNVRHYGRLGLAEHDGLAARCDVGLILYTTDDPYQHRRPTLKYSAYLANGLAVLATDLHCVDENVRRDEVGRAMPIRDLEVEILRWATRPKLWQSAKARAAALAPAVRSPTELRDTIAEIATSA